MRVSLPFFIVLCFFACFAVPAEAQVPSAVEPSRMEGQIAPMTAPGPPEVSAKVEAEGVIEAPPGTEGFTLLLREIRIEGQTVYDPAELAAVYKDLIGKTVTLAEVFGIASRLTARYRNDGYILTQVIIPPQTIENGIVTLRVVEGFVDRVTIQGATRRNIAWLEGFAEKIRAARPLNAKTLERYILLMNDLAGVQARTVLSPSATPGASDVAIIVEQKPFDAFFQADNRGTRFIGPLQFNAGARLHNIFGLYEGLNVQAAATPGAGWGKGDPELGYIALAWQQPLNHEGTALSLGASFTETHPGFTLKPFDIDGYAKAVNVELSHPWIRARNMNLHGALKYNYLNTHRNDNLGTGGADDQLSVLRASYIFQFADRWQGASTIAGEISKGLGILGASGRNDPFPTRATGDPRFFKATGEATRVQRLTNRLEAFLSATGQLSAHTLLASEEFGVGGISYGSAYDNSEITGEDGYAARFELRANNPVATPAQILQLYGFADGGQVHDPDNATPKARRRSLVSAGGGLRVTFSENFSGTIEIAFPLTAPVAAESNKDPRGFFTLTGRF